MAGIACNVPLVVDWISNDFRLLESTVDSYSYVSSYGLMLLGLGFQTFCFALLLALLPPQDID